MGRITRINDLKVWDIFLFNGSKVYCVYLGGTYYYSPSISEPEEFVNMYNTVTVIGRQVQVIFEEE